MSQNPSKAAILRRLLNTAGCVLTAGSHDAMSARLAEEAGFDAIWASGFGVSLAQHGISDANILTMTESLEAASRMNQATSIPVIADCDNGYGNAINVMRTVREYERNGIAAICIEDNEFPKRCSFYEGVQRQVVSIDEHVGKIKAALAARTNPDFVIIARCEALILGIGQEEALKRAKAYAKAGADMVLVHSKAKSFDELRKFSESYRKAGLTTPMVAVPTTYPTVGLDELEKHGFKVVIFANQAARASLKAMRSVLGEMKRSGSAATVKDQIAAMEEVYSFVKVTELQSEEKKFIPQPEPISAVILAAGFEKSLLPLTAEKPKAMLEVHGKPILEHQVQRLKDCGVGEVSVVRGYMKAAVNIPGAKFFDNDDFEHTSELYSFFKAEAALKGRTVFLYGDLMFDEVILKKMLASQSDYTLMVDISRGAGLRRGGPAAMNGRHVADWVVFDKKSIPADPLMALETPGLIQKIARQIPSAKAHGEFAGLAMFSAPAVEMIKKVYAEAKKKGEGKPFHEADSLNTAKMTDLFQELIDRKQKIYSLNVSGGWLDVDTIEDYARAWGRL